MRPMQMAVHEAHLRAQGEESDGKRPGLEARAVHGQAEHGGEKDQGENQLSHGRPLTLFRPPPVPD